MYILGAIIFGNLHTKNEPSPSNAQSRGGK
jgi:hypothetical protein